MRVNSPGPLGRLGPGMGSEFRMLFMPPPPPLPRLLFAVLLPPEPPGRMARRRGPREGGAIQVSAPPGGANLKSRNLSWEKKGKSGKVSHCTKSLDARLNGERSLRARLVGEDREDVRCVHRCTTPRALVASSQIRGRVRRPRIRPPRKVGARGRARVYTNCHKRRHPVSREHFYTFSFRG